MHYLDHAATTPLRASARDAWLSAQGKVGNPSSLHAAGRRARAIVEDARESVAASLGAHPTEVVFTSGATEANNLAIQGSGARIIVSSPIEHHSAMDPVKWLESAGAARVSWLSVLPDGVVQVGDLPALEGGAGLVSLQWVNNETGVVQPVEAAVEAAMADGYRVHSDAVQAVAYVAVDFSASGLTTMAVSAHKVGGPVGVGALLVRRDARLAPLAYGGGQQRFRSGTLDAAGAAAFAVALAETVAEREVEAARLSAMRAELAAWFASSVPGVQVTGTGVPAAPHILHVVRPGQRAELMLSALDMAGVEVSSGSACTAGVVDASHVLVAMGRTEADAASGLRVSLGRTTVPENIEALKAALAAIGSSS
ncbi:cysteine desulfurase family protein [Demequina sp.]|uniref:cysteine desulfurase family protein n=1 Tax=Demequina sp. TaxID=2050685 RepID=UPI003D12B955